MNITVQQIDRWRSEPSEHQRLEFKEAKSGYPPEKTCKYCVALANEGGGHLVCGVSDQAGHPVVGSAVAGNPVKTADKLFQLLGFRVEVEAVDHPCGRVVVFTAPPRPRGSAYHFKGAYWMRSGASLVPMSEDQLRKIFAETKVDWLAEISRDGLRAGEVLRLLDTQKFFQLLELPYPTNNKGVFERLVSERLVSRANGRYSIHRIGALLLANQLQDFPDVTRKAARVVVYKGGSKLQTGVDQTASKGYAVGFQGLVSLIVSLLPRNEIISNALRSEVALAPEVIVRELVANALIHQDFAVEGASVMVEIYDRRLEISNPGDPIVPAERFIDGYQSRNDRLADLMRRMRICEEKGSGIDKVIAAAETHQLPAPKFENPYRRTAAIVFAPGNFETMNRDDRIRGCYQHCALKWVLQERMTNQTLRERFRLPAHRSAVVSQVIQTAVEAGAIKPDEAVGASRRFAAYLPYWA